MKAKHLLTALALPAVFAACTNEEIVQENQNLSSALENRPVVDLTINAYKHGGEAAESRIVGGDYNGGIRWYWEDENDKIGAVVVDFITNGGGNIVDANLWDKYVITNYPFAPQISGMAAKANFQTPTAVVEGAYIFYNRYDGEMTTRGKITHSIPRILTASEGHEEGLTQVGTPENGGQNFFVSPIYKVAVADGEEVETNVGMKAIHSILKFTLKTDLKKSDSDPNYYYDKGFKVSKIELKALGSKKFDRTFVLNPKEVSNAQLAALNAYRDAATTSVEKARRQSLYSSATGEIYTIDRTNEDVEEATAVVANYITNPKNSTLGIWSDNTEVLTYELDEPYVFEGKDQTMELMVVVPAAEYDQATGLSDKYEDKNQGVFLMKVYTSEGIYNSYLLTGSLKASDSAADWILTDNKYTLARGVQYTMPTKTMKIDGGQTNITLFEQTDKFIVETTSDWNYTIEYILEHYRDYGNNNSWTTPQVEFKGESVITVDADHYFPNFPIKYSGAKTLNLVGQEEYVFDPITAIFATGADRPTLKVVNQPEATFSFKGDVDSAIKNYKGGISTDGKDATHAVKLVSDAQVNIAESQEVNFEHLESATALILNEGATVNVNDATHDAKTGGVVDVHSGAKLNIDNDWANAAEVNVETEALVKVLDEAVNNGTVNVWGDLNVKTFNNGSSSIGYVAEKLFASTQGNLVVKGYAEGMNNNERGIAQFINLTNASNSEITTEVSSSSKANYGGWIIVGVLNADKTSVNSASGKLVNNGGDINVYGELMAAEVQSKGKITLGGDPYALLILLDGNVTTGTEGYKGSVVLEDASEYPMFDNYYAKWNDISGVVGTIETILDNETYQEVIANFDNSNYGSKERAWEVLNKVTLVDDVYVKHNTENERIEFVLADEAKLNAYENDITVGAITVDGVDAAITATPASGNSTQTINIVNGGILKVNEDASATIEAKANVIFNKSAAEMIELDGALLNKGYIDVVSTKKDTKINTLIETTGELINEGRLSMPSSIEIAELVNKAAVEEFIGWLGEDLLGDNEKNIQMYYNFYSTKFDEWKKATEMNSKLLKKILTERNIKQVGSSTVLYYKVESSEKATYGVSEHGYYYVWVRDYSKFTSIPTGYEAIISEAESTKKYSGRTMFDQVVDKVTKDTPYSEAYASWFNVVNYGLLDLLYSADAENTNSWAYGESNNGDKATKSGKFNNELGSGSY